MKALGRFINKGIWQAGLAALIFALLPLFSWVALIIIALVTLRKGLQQGVIVLLWACLPVIAMVIAGWHSSNLQAYYFCATSCSVLLMAYLLRSSSWAMMLQIMAGLGIVAVLILHGFYPELVTQMQNYVANAFSQSNIELANQQQMIQLWAQSAVHLLVVSILAFSCLWLALARWWQSVLFNPGKLALELHNIRLNKYLAVVLVLLLVALVVVRTPWLIDIFPVALLPFAIAGLSVVHSFAKAKKLNVIWLVFFYIVLILFMGIISAALAVLAVLDAWFNIRQQWQK